MNTDNKQDGAEPSPASTGSVQPMLYAVMQAESVLEYCRDAKEAAASAGYFNGNVVPLYRSPTLTEAEREAIERACRVIASTLPYGSQRGAEDYQTLRGLLKRMSPTTT